MKKISVFMFVLVLLLTSILLTSCGGIGLSDVQEDPFAYLEKGVKLTFSNTPFAPLLEKDGKQILADISVEEGENLLQAKVALDQESAKFYLDGKYKEVFDAEEGAENMEMDLALWFADNKFVVKNEFLKELFGSDTIGIDFNATKDTVKNSSLYQAVLSALDMNAAELTEEQKTALQAIENEIDTLISKIKEILKNTTVLDGVAEEKITVGEKELETITVSLKLKDKYMEEIANALVAFANGINEAMGSEDAISSEDLSLPKMSSSQKYYLAKESGALVRAEMISSTKVSETEVSDAVETITSFSLDFGADPQKQFLPAFTYELTSNEINTEIRGTSSQKDGKFVMTMTVKEDEEEVGDLVFTMEKDGNFTMTVSDEEEEQTVAGTLKNEDGALVFTSTVPSEEDGGEDTKVTLKLRASAEIPAVPEFKDLLTLTEDDLAVLMEAFGAGSVDYASVYYNQLLYYTNTTEDQLDALLDDFANQGYASREDYIYASYAQYAYQDLVTNSGVSSAELDQYLNTVVNENSSYLELAIAVDDAYYALVLDEA